MKLPICQKTEVLYSLLQGQMTTLQMVSLGICNPTSVMTGLRKEGVDVVCNKINRKNKYGRKISYGKFTIGNLSKAKSIYNKLTKVKS